MGLIFPPRLITSTYAQQASGFNIYYFKNINHAPDAPAHYHVVISLKNGLSVVLCIITSQMQRLEEYYSKTDPDAIKSLVSLDPTIFSCISKPCVINCNEAELLTTTDMALLIDPVIGIQTKEYDKNFDTELKVKILQAIQDSPLLNEDIPSALKNALPEFY